VTRLSFFVVVARFAGEHGVRCLELGMYIRVY